MAEDHSDSDHYPIIIAGSGIAGLTAAIYAGRANNDPLVLEGDEPGGQLTLTSEVENYPGFPEGVGGVELVQEMKAQAKRFGAEVENGIVESVDDANRPFTVRLTNGEEYTCNALIAASGASARTLNIPGEDELMGYGVSTCATCDGAFFRGEDMLVVGGGDAAAEEAAFLTRFADTVYVAHRRDELRAEGYLEDRLMEKEETGDVEVLWNTEVTEVTGTKDDGVDEVEVISHPDGHPSEKDASDVERKTLDVGAVFIAIGHTPNTDYLRDTAVELDDTGYITTVGGEAEETKTAVKGIFGAGDVVDHHYQQAVTAAGMGCKAALDAEHYLDQLE